MDGILFGKHQLLSGRRERRQVGDRGLCGEGHRSRSGCESPRATAQGAMAEKRWRRHARRSRLQQRFGQGAGRYAAPRRRVARRVTAQPDRREVPHDPPSTPRRPLRWSESISRRIHGCAYWPLRQAQAAAQVQTIAIPSPSEGVVRKAFRSAKQAGPAAEKESPRAPRRRRASLPFPRPSRGWPAVDRALVLAGRASARLGEEEPNRPVVSSNISLPVGVAERGLWRAELRAGGRVVQTLSLRIG